MIEAIKKFMGEYRAVGIEQTRGTEGHGFYALIMKNGRVLGEVADYADGASVNIHFPIKKDEEDLIAYAKTIYPEAQYEQAGIFLGGLIDYELAVKNLISKAKKALLVADETELDEHGVAEGFSTWKLPNTPDNRALILQKHPQTKFLNDELDTWEQIKKPRK